ncbi:MAG: hypothetical protein H8F28_20370 [Fibrella sp.]|nr:hypothetical protein [Armatimonadota bacterium]
MSTRDGASHRCHHMLAGVILPGVIPSAETLDTVPTPAKPEGDVSLYLEVTI